MSPQIYFITGTSSGFGLHLTELALAQGDIVIATLRTPSALDDLVARHGTDRLLVLPLDITKPEQRVAALEAAKSRFGRIDVFINNAGQVGPVGELEGVPSELARSLFDINFWATLDMTSIEVAFLRDVNKPQGGRIFNISSFVGYSSYPGCGIYNASKHALESVTESYSKELDPAWNIKLTLVEPGSFNTDVVKSFNVLPAHSAYTNPSIAVNQMREMFKTFKSPGDAVLAAKAILKLTRLPANELPLRQPIGSDAVALIKGGLKVVEDDMNRGEALAKEADVKEEATS